MKRKILIALAAILLILAGSLVWLLGTYHIVDGTLYRKDLTDLDLRGQEISAEHYEKLQEKLTDTPIRWDVPFQDGLLADDTQEVTVTRLSAEDARILAKFLPKLRRVDARDCSDFENLVWLKQACPALQVEYRVPVGGKTYAGTAVQLTLSSIAEEELECLNYFPFLKTVTVTGGRPEVLKQLRDRCKEANLTFRMQIGNEVLEETAMNVTLTGITEEALPLLQLLPELKTLHLIEPVAGGAQVVALAESLDDVKVTWEKTVLGLTFRQDAKQIDLTDAIALGEGERLGDKTGYQYSLEFPVQGTQEEVPTAVKISQYHPIADKTEQTKDLIAEVEAAMAYFPEAEEVLMLGGMLHNVHMDKFRENHREDYKVVWSVRCGKLLTRSDATFFMPVKYHVYYLSDGEAYNLRYLKDAVAVDIGHMNVSDISFVKYMPNLEYLILAHTSIQYIEPIRSCQKLKFLEVDWTGIRDLSPLVDCKTLEDLNVGNTGADLEPLKQMTWLKNLWAIFRGGSVYAVSQALPNTKVVSSGNATVASGWRDLPNYYAMRDALKMYYMKW